MGHRWNSRLIHSHPEHSSPVGISSDCVAYASIALPLFMLRLPLRLASPSPFFLRDTGLRR
ncbi:hypothetical protein DW66_5397 [Pseudomonas putida]|nr:hypothetical protein DW66_5397 [Pseudomonas putida]AJG16865.1 hypothetical protein RK21_05357 [Pseudomonas plecoglossicida]